MKPPITTLTEEVQTLKLFMELSLIIPYSIFKDFIQSF